VVEVCQEICDKATTVLYFALVQQQKAKLWKNRALEKFRTTKIFQRTESTN